MKSISGNVFPYLRVFGCARKMHFPEMLFSWPVNGCKLISIFILPSNSHFPENRDRAKGEGDAPARREREEEERGDDRFAIRLLLRRSTSNPFDFALRLRHLTSPSRRSRSQSQHRFVVPDREPRFVAPQNRSSSLSSFFSQFDRIMIFFFLGFICVSV